MKVTAKWDVDTELHEQRQKALSHVHWDNQPVDNSWRFKYLGSLFQADGYQMPDILTRTVMAKTRSDTLRHIWDAELSMDLKIRLYISR